MENIFNSIEEAIEDIKAGKIIIVVDDENRENEGDFLMAGAHVTPEAINFMSKEGRGLICTPISEEIAKRLDLHLMCKDNSEMYSTNFTISIDHKETNTTGISAFDRANTVKALINPSFQAHDFARPGHTFPLIARNGGVIERAGHTEACVELAKLAGLAPIGVICEIMNDDGSMARVPDLIKIAQKYNLKLITIEALIEYQKNRL